MPRWNLKDLWKTIFLYNPLVFRFHVDLGTSSCTFEPGESSFAISVMRYLEVIEP